MVKLTNVFLMSILVFWLAVSGCVENNKNAQEAVMQETPGADVNGNASAEKLTEEDVHEFEQNVTDLENLLENSSEEIVVEKL